MDNRTAKDFWTDHSTSLDETLFPKELIEFLRAEEGRIRQYCQEKKPKLVLEAGCGRGRIIEVISPYCKQVRGVDYSPAMARFSTKKFRDNPQIKIYQEDISQMHFPNNSFDLGILAFNTIGNTNTNKEKVLLELKRVLKPDAEMLISAYSEHSKAVQLDIYKRLGLDILKEENNRVYTREGLVSQRFSKTDLEAWMQVCGLRGNIDSLTKIGYFVIARGG
ncbi:MAG TPA: class I SAM-dependent methyltransferase [Candidatus Nanoarchaeia archaeon]|nr:class I SAM-dependent methyltransferase [Candidatus Nanoarchaeia archaeon]